MAVSISKTSREILLACVVLGCIFATAKSTYDGEKTSEQVEAAIYQLKKDEWSKYEKTFQTAVSEEATTYCDNAASACGMKTDWTTNGTFSDTDLKLTEDSPTYRKPRLYLTFAVQLPEYSADGTKTMFFLNKEAVEQVAGNVIKRFRTETGYSITEVDGKIYGIPPDNTLNAILIPIAFALLIGVCVAMCVLNYKCGVPPEPVEKEDNDVGDKEAVRPMTQETTAEPQKC